jgi:hypothetical protein
VDLQALANGVVNLVITLLGALAIVSVTLCALVFAIVVVEVTRTWRKEYIAKRGKEK